MDMSVIFGLVIVHPLGIALLFARILSVRQLLVAYCLFLTIMGVVSTDNAARYAANAYRASGNEPGEEFFDGVLHMKAKVFSNGIPFFLGTIAILIVLVLRAPWTTTKIASANPSKEDD